MRATAAAGAAGAAMADANSGGEKVADGRWAARKKNN